MMKKSTLVIGLTGIVALVGMISVFSTSNSVYTPRPKDGRMHQQASNYFSIMRRNIHTGKVEVADYYKALQEARQIAGQRSVNGLTWMSAGPDNVGGRTRALLIDKDDPNKLFAGGVTGGLYVSTNAGGTWTYLSDGWENINISTIVQDGDGTIYVGTGCAFDASAPSNFDNYPGGGIWRSTDGGQTFTRITSTIPAQYSPSDEWAYINRLAVSNSKNSNGYYTIYAGTRKGLKVSVDNGQTWFKPLHIDPACTVPDNGNIHDIVLTSDDKVFVARNGSLWTSTDGTTDCSYTQVSSLPASSSRMSIAVCPSDENVMYAMAVYASSRTLEIFKSTDKGDTWEVNQPLPPTQNIDSNFNIFGMNPVAYNQALSVHPSDCGKLFVGAVQLYRVAGSWTRVSYEFGGGPGYVHSDKHWFVHDKKSPNIMYLCTDGGIGKSSNAQDVVMNFTTNNRGYRTTQYYGIAFSKEGVIIGGTQDNGTHLIDPNSAGMEKEAFSIFGGDGFDCEISTLGDVAFVTSQFGVVGRFEPSGNIIVIAAGVPSPFFSVVKLWENRNDLTSLDSIVFKNDTMVVSVGSGDGLKREYTGTIIHPQPFAVLVPGSLVFKDIGGNQEATDLLQPGVLMSQGDSIGWIDYTTGEFQLRWKSVPPQGSVIKARYLATFNAGDTLFMNSKNMEVPFTYVLTTNLDPGDSVMIQDPVQTLLVNAIDGGINITREALRFPFVLPNFTTINNTMFANMMTPSTMEFSKDGNHLYIGGYNGRVVRISGLNNWYREINPADTLTVTTIFSGQSVVSGLALNPDNQNELIVTVGGYGGLDHIYMLENAQDASSVGAAMKRTLQGNLPDFPVYDAEYNVNNTDEVLIGTELGVWATNNVHTTSVSWSNESGDIGNTPVLDIRQQWLSWKEASNHGVFYAGTHGRGIWTSTNLVSVKDNDFADFADDSFKPELNLYPNPVQTNGAVSFDLPKASVVEIIIYDLNGRMVSRHNRAYPEGEVVYEFTTERMRSGTYLMTVRAGEAMSTGRFVVVK